MPDNTPPSDSPERLPAPIATAEPLGAPPGWRADLLTASLFLTRVKLSRFVTVPAASAGGLTHALRAFPLVGAAIGLAAALVYWLASLFGLSPLPAALLTIGVTVWLTGGLHEDGLADCA